MTNEQEYEVNICRTSFAFANVRVKANSLDEATERALNEAGNHSYSEKDADYTFEGVTPVETKEVTKEVTKNIAAEKAKDTNQVGVAPSKNKPK